MKTLTMITAALALLAGTGRAQQVEVVSTLSVYASIAEAIGGERVAAASIARGDEDAHFVKPKPSFALMLRKADLFITTGLDLELWAPVLVDKSGNKNIREGQQGYVSASQGARLLDVPQNASREAGDVHIFGNPHLFTSPIAAKRIAANIAAGLTRADPAGAEVYGRNLEAFVRRVNQSLYGAELVSILGAEALDGLAESGKLIAFLEGQQVEGSPAIEKLGGWLGKGLAFRDKEIIAYHKNWVYFTTLFGLEVVDYVEPKPGIPPSARHVKELIDEIERRGIKVLIAASYFDPQQPRTIAQRTGCRDVILSLGVGAEGPSDYFALVDSWIDSIADAFSGKGA